MSKWFRALTTFAAAAVFAAVLSPAVLRAQSTSGQQNKQNNGQNPSVQSQQEPSGQQQQNPNASPVPPNPEGALPYQPPPGPPPASVSPPSYEDQYTNQTDSQQQDQEENQLINQEEGPSQGGGGPQSNQQGGAAGSGVQEGTAYVGPDGMVSPPSCQQQSQQQNCGQAGGSGSPPL